MSPPPGSQQFILVPNVVGRPALCQPPEILDKMFEGQLDAVRRSIAERYSPKERPFVIVSGMRMPSGMILLGDKMLDTAAMEKREEAVKAAVAKAREKTAKDKDGEIASADNAVHGNVKLKLEGDAVAGKNDDK